MRCSELLPLIATLFYSTRLDEKAEEARRAIERVGKLDAL
jgi:hypothetical protein